MNIIIFTFVASFPALALSYHENIENASIQYFDGTVKFISAFDQQIQQIELWASTELAQNKKLIYFYEVGPVSFLGNFSLSRVTVDNLTFACAEAAYQYKKYKLLADHNGISSSTDPLCKAFLAQLNRFLDPQCTGEKAFRIHRELGGVEKYDPSTDQNKIIKAGLVHSIAQLYGKNSLYADEWTTGVRDQVMWKILRVKFAPETGLYKLLKATKDAYLLEHNNAKRDSYWSDNSDGSGQNMLGRMLMAIRDGQPMPIGQNSSDFMDYVHLANENPHNYQIFKP